MKADLEKSYRLAEALQTAADPFARGGSHDTALREFDAQRSREARRGAIYAIAAAVICFAVFLAIAGAGR